MATRHGRIVDSIVRLLRDAQIVEDRVYRDRGITLDASLLPAIDVQLDRSEPIDMGVAATRHDLRIKVSVIAREFGGRSPSELADDVLEDAHRALMADRTLGGLCRRLVLERQDWRYQQSGDGVLVALESVYVAVHATKADDLAVAAV